MKKTIYIFRHGDTDYNKSGILQGQSLDIQLNNDGIWQANELSKAMSDKPLQAIYSSNLLRALQTAAILAMSKNIPIFINEKLKEINFGIAEGKSPDQISKTDLEKHFSWDDMNFKFENGESKQEMQTRIVSTLFDILKNDFSCIGIATHGGVIANLLKYFGICVNKKIPMATPIEIHYENDKLYLISDFN